jgi:uncharacterized membrane protein
MPDGGSSDAIRVECRIPGGVARPILEASSRQECPMLPDPLHPILVHFPIVLAVLAPLAAIGAFFAIRRGAAPRRAWAVPVVTLAALVLSAWISTATGEREEEKVERVVAERAIETHEEAAELFLYSAAGVLLVALVGFGRGTTGRVARVAGAVGTVVLVALGVNVGSSGGDLVYRHGAAQAYVDGAGATAGGGVGEAARDRGHDDTND